MRIVLISRHRREVHILLMTASDVDIIDVMQNDARRRMTILIPSTENNDAITLKLHQHATMKPLLLRLIRNLNKIMRDNITLRTIILIRSNRRMTEVLHTNRALRSSRDLDHRLGLTVI